MSVGEGDVRASDVRVRAFRRRSIATRLALALFVSAATLAACGSPPPERAEAVEPPFLKVERRRHPDAGTPWKQWDVLVYADGRREKHGVECTWYPDGQLERERHFEHGAITGRLRTWYPDGTPRSDYTFGAPGEATTMRFWHPTGALEAEGPAVQGDRRGAWRFYDTSGALSESGAYAHSKRTGVWREYHPDGSLAAQGTYVKGKKVGSWERWPIGLRLP